jgi:8-oxo-dGTP pyrophosphatase MutT (NUDIX family)
VREAREEVAVDVELEALVALYQLGPERHGLRVVFAGHTDDDTVPQPDEIDEIGWFDVERLPDNAAATMPYAVRDAVAGARGVTRRIQRRY